MLRMHLLIIIATTIVLSAGPWLATARAQDASPMVPPAQGYGSRGVWETAADSLPHPAIRGMSVYFFYPAGAPGPFPVMLFCHGITATNPRIYQALVSFLVSKGFAVVYAPYETAIGYTRPSEAYRQMRAGFAAAADTWADRCDTARAGFIGHSFGGGAVPAIAYDFIVNRKWGSAGTFLFIMAPWYSYDITDAQLESFPPSANIIIEVYDNDQVIDHRMAVDLFNTFGTDRDKKDFVILFGDSTAQYRLDADHGVPVGELQFGPGVDILDYYGVHRLVDALADYSFTGNDSAKTVALGNGGAAQRFMGVWSDGDTVTPAWAGDAPPLLHPQSFYTNFWSHRINPRAFSIHDSARVDHELTWRNYLRTPFYRKWAAEVLDDSQEIADTADTMDEDDLQCWVAPPLEGWGAEGPYQPHERMFPHPGKGEANVHVITPHGLKTRAPVVLFAPAWWKPSTMFYRGLIDHIVSRGAVVIFSTYNMSRFLNHRLRYQVLLDGFRAGLELAADRIDTSRIAIVGHSYGGGAVPAVAYEFCVNRHWGAGGTALFVMSPWFMRNITPEQLAALPPHLKLVVQTYDGNRKMDWRIAEDIFFNINVHPDEKDYYYVRDAMSDDCEIDADHDAPQAEDADEITVIDYYAIWRVLDALMDYSFTGSTAAKAVALGNGGREQLFMGYWQDGRPVEAMRVTDRPETPIGQRAFLFKWRDRMNKRRRLYHPPQ
jgi:acetyl esterase/lipase